MTINTKEITTVLQELHRITGFRISLHGVNFEEIAAYPECNLEFCASVHSKDEELKRCLECDSRACSRAASTHDTVIYTCRYGLVEAVSPLYDYDTLTGYLMMGQVLASSDVSEIESFKRRHGDVAKSIPTVMPDMVNSYVHIMTICAKYLTLSNAVPQRSGSLAKSAKRFIHENLERKLTIAIICDVLKCSKTSLLRSFKAEYGTTVNAYITEQKLQLAKKILEGGAKSICEVAREVGFADQSYFSKVFSTRYGMPPSEFAHRGSATKENKRK